MANAQAISQKAAGHFEKPISEQEGGLKESGLEASQVKVGLQVRQDNSETARLHATPRIRKRMVVGRSKAKPVSELDGPLAPMRFLA